MKARTAVVITALASLVGCASTPKPELTESQYTQYAQWFVGAERCAIKGFTQPELVAYGNTYVRYKLGAYAYSPERLNAEISNTNASLSSEPTRENCNALALGISEIKRHQELNTADGEMQQQALQETNEMLRSNTPRNTYCNKFGAQTICNTY